MLLVRLKFDDSFRCDVLRYDMWCFQLLLVQLEAMSYLCTAFVKPSSAG